MRLMLSRFVAILLLMMLAVLPPAGEAIASIRAGHCTPAALDMVMERAQLGAAQHDCEHGSSHRQLPCTMMGLCTMSGCMAVPAISAPETVAIVHEVTFLVPNSLRVDGLAHAPPLEPPRA